MRSSSSSILGHGAIAGLLAGLIVALWFLVVDVATGQALRTPALLASALFGAATDGGTVLVISYTIVHLAVFAALGMATAGLLRAAGLAPGLILGALFGVIVLSAVHYGALLLTGTNVLRVLPAVHVLLANTVAGMAMMAYLHRATESETVLGLANVRYFPLLERGLVTGAVGAAAVALWMLAVDAIMGRPLFTPAALGAVFFLGAQSPDEVRITFGMVASYTMFHLFAFAIVGIALEWAADRVERAPQMWVMALLAVIILEALFLGVVSTAGQWVLDAVGLFSVVIANLLSIVAMGVWLWLKHPRLRDVVATVSPAS